MENRKLKKLKLILIILISIILFGTNKIKAYYSVDIKKDISITTMEYKDLFQQIKIHMECVIKMLKLI